MIIVENKQALNAEAKKFFARKYIETFESATDAKFCFNMKTL